MLEMNDSDVNLIEGLCRQSRKAQEQALETYGSYVWTQVIRLVSSVEDAEEVYQDVFIKAFRNIRKYERGKSSFQTWISRIAYNESISFLRRNRKPEVYLDETDSRLDNITEEQAEDILGRTDSNTVELIKAAIRHLPPDEQAIVTLFYYDDMSLKEIAYITNSVPSNVGSKLSRARKKLCQIINLLKS